MSLSKKYQSEMPIFFTPPLTKWDKRCHGDAPDPPQTDPRMYEIMDKQVGLSADALSFVQKAYEENKVRQTALDSMNMKLADGYLKDADTNRQRSQDSYDFYINKGRPVIEKAMDEAKDYDSEGNISAFRGRAAADVNQAYGNVEGQLTRNLSRMGVMPNANRMATINGNLAIQKAAAQAGAMTNAEQGVRDRAVGMRTNAANIAAGFPAQTLQFGAAGQSAGQTAFGNSVNTMGASNANTNSMTGGFNSAGGMLGQAAGTGQGIFNGQSNIWGQQANAQAQENAGYGQAVGMAGTAAIMMMADGGEVRGPGTGISDSVPAMNTDNGQQIRLSNGEFIVPADVVRAKGEEFFHKLIEKHHTPAAIQRRARG